MGKQTKSISEKLHQLSSILSAKAEKKKEKILKEEIQKKKQEAAIVKLDTDIVLPALKTIKKQVEAAGFKAEIEKEENTIGHDLTVYLKSPANYLTVGVFYNYQTEQVELWGNLDDGDNLYELEWQQIPQKISSEQMLTKINGAIDELLAKVKRGE